MFGYLKPYSVNASIEARRVYKKYYCSLCHALWKNYGQASRLIVSYDITFIAVVLAKHFTLPDGKISCLAKSTTTQSESNWKKLAAFSIMMAVSKLEDDIQDDKSIKARIGGVILGSTVKKVRKDFPRAYEVMLNFMKIFDHEEAAKSDVHVLSDAFSDIVINTLKTLFTEIDDADISILRHVTRWVYFIDAVDDFDQDLRKEKKNPFTGMADSKHDLVNKQFAYIGAFIDKSVSELLKSIKAEYEFISPERRVIANIIDGTIPEMTYNVFSDAPCYPKSSMTKTTIRKGVMFG